MFGEGPGEFLVSGERSALEAIGQNGVEVLVIGEVGGDSREIEAAELTVPLPLADAAGPLACGAAGQRIGSRTAGRHGRERRVWMGVLSERRVAAVIALGGLAAVALALMLSGADAAATKCFGKTPTIRGNGVTINGTNGDDVILAGDRDNQIEAKAGKDYVCARGGQDNIDGGKGRTYARGGAGKDHFEGRGANDVFYGGGDDDISDPGGGADKIHGGPGNDGSNNSLAGDEGNDTIYGDEGSDNISGDEGNDFCDGGPGNDAASDCEREVSIP